MESAFRRIVRYFFSGTLFIVPLVATVYFILASFRWLDNLLELPYPGLGFAIIFFCDNDLRIPHYKFCFQNRDPMV